MPEAAEVERARKALEALAKGRRIKKCEANVDNIVFSGVTAEVFASTLEGKTVEEVRRKGKNFYLILDSPHTPIFHFGMSGSSQTRGLAADTYRVPRAKNDPKEWPPKYCKTVLTFEDATTGEEVGEWAFCDSRRLGRIKLIEGEDPEVLEPLVSLGRDCFLDMPTVDEIAESLSKRNAPIKSVLLDQKGPVCGIGNWMADEILYQSRIHPSHPASSLSSPQIIALHAQIRDVTAFAIKVNAEASLFPENWLFKSRWGKGKKGGNEFVLPSGETTTITFVTVGGRTSAVIEALQVLPPDIIAANAAAQAKRDSSKKAKEDSKREAEEGEREGEETVGGTSPHFKKVKKLKIEELPAPPKFKLPSSLVSPRKTRGRVSKE